MRAICVDQGIAQGQSAGLTLDLAGDILLGDQANRAIDVYPPHATKPSRSISVPGGDPIKFALDKREKKLYVADYVNDTVEIYDYTTGMQFGTISAGLQSAWGVSLSPAAKYGR